VVRIADDPSGDCERQPEASALVTRESQRPVAHLLDIGAPHPAVRANGNEWQVSPIAQIDDVLARRVEYARRLAGGQ